MKARRGQRVGLVVLVVLSFVASACNEDDEEDDGPSCRSLCEQAQRCPGSDQSADCGSQCDQVKDLLRSAGCTGEYDDLLACFDDEPDICTIDEYACQSENATLSECIDSYCTNHQQECIDALS